VKGRCEEYEQFRKIDAAFRAGDLIALRAAVDESDSIPNGPMPLTIGRCLEYAIYHSPLSFIRTLLEIGADPNPEDHSGFPPLIAALSCSRPQPGSPGRSDVIEIVTLLLSFGSDPNQRGINDCTALHVAAGERNLPAIERLLEAGANASNADRRLRNAAGDGREGWPSRNCRVVSEMGSPSHSTVRKAYSIPPQSCVRSLNCVRRIECGHVRLMSGDPPQDVHALGIGELEETRNHLQ
jgi:uncharacterized protein